VVAGGCVPSRLRRGEGAIGPPLHRYIPLWATLVVIVHDRPSAFVSLTIV
jgi:hypothetical protein